MYWEYDSRIARRWNLDPKPNASISQYSCFAGNPILYQDPKGDTIRFPKPQWWGNKEFSWSFQEDINDIYSSKYGKALVRQLHSSEVYINVTEAWALFGGDLSDAKKSITDADVDGSPRIFSDGTKNVSLSYASVKNVSIDDVNVQNSWEILAHEFVHARDFANSYFKKIKKDHNLNDKQIHDIGEIRSMIFTNAMRIEKYGIDADVRTEYRGEKLLKDDGLTPIKDYGFDVTEGLLETVEN